MSSSFFCRSLGEAYGLDLIELDRIQPNFPAIDLGDTKGRRCFQITSDKSGAKMQDTFDKYVEKRLHDKYDRITILVIGERQREYKTLRAPDAIRFNSEDDVLGTPEVIKHIGTLETPVLECLAEIVRTELRVGDQMGSPVQPGTGSGTGDGPPVFQFGEVKTLPLCVVPFVLLEPLRAFGSAKAQLMYGSPEYEPPSYATNPEWLERIGKEPSAAIEMANSWLTHVTQFQYFTQFRDDTDRRLVSRLHSHTELVSLLCDARLGVDSTLLWAAGKPSTTSDVSPAT